MALSLKTRRRLSIVILLLALPAYVVAALLVVSMLDGRPNALVEVAIYAGLGVLWIFPLRFVFKGVGKGEVDEDASKG